MEPATPDEAKRRAAILAQQLAADEKRTRPQ